MWQTVRRKSYRGRSTALNVQDTGLPSGAASQSFVYREVSNLELPNANIENGTLIMHLTLHDTEDHFVREDSHISEQNNESLLLVKVDEFLERSV